MDSLCNSILDIPSWIVCAQREEELALDREGPPSRVSQSDRQSAPLISFAGLVSSHEFCGSKRLVSVSSTFSSCLIACLLCAHATHPLRTPSANQSLVRSTIWIVARCHAYLTVVDDCSTMLDEYPVDERDVPRVKISAQKLEEWREVGHEEVTRALTHRNSWYFQFQEKTQDGYEQIADKDNLKAYARSVPNSPHKNVLIRASLETTLDAIVYGLYCESTYEQRCAFAHLYEDHFLDGGVLHVGQTRTRDDPFRFVGMKWVAFRSPAPALVTSRDFIYFSYSGTMRDANGQRVLFRLLRSMPMDGVDVQERRNNNLVRGKISYLYLYRENGSRTEVSIQALHSTAGNLPSWAVTKTISFVWPGIFNLVTVAEAKILMMNGMAGVHANPIFCTSSSGSGSSISKKSKSSSFSSNPSSCGVCFRRFRLMRSKRMCTGCMRDMCKSCTVKLSFLDERKERSDTGVVPLRFCLNCMVKARTERMEVTAHMLRDDSVDLDFDDDFNALDVSLYRETLKTKYLDVLSGDEDDIDDTDDLDDIEYIEPQFTSSRIKLNEEPSYSSGESYEGTSIMSSNPSFASSMSSVEGSTPFTMSAASKSHLSRPSSVPDLLQFNSSRGPRSGYASNSIPDLLQFNSGRGRRSGSARSTMAKSTSMVTQEVDDLEQTFRLRMMLFPNGTEEDALQSEVRQHNKPARPY